ADYIPFNIRYRNNGVVECRADMCHTCNNLLFHTAFTCTCITCHILTSLLISSCLQLQFLDLCVYGRCPLSFAHAQVSHDDALGLYMIPFHLIVYRSMNPHDEGHLQLCSSQQLYGCCLVRLLSSLLHVYPRTHQLPSRFPERLIFRLHIHTSMK